mmetsp:Transcript_139536/g.389190  ORF Transcript_139536/g.389190 Transcript_139536/m.389190 type:complete len:291 (-) Transcript_139536:486-1358(-)
MGGHRCAPPGARGPLSACLREGPSSALREVHDVPRHGGERQIRGGAPRQDAGRGRIHDLPQDKKAPVPVAFLARYVCLHLHAGVLPLPVASLHDLLRPAGQLRRLHRRGGWRLDGGAGEAGPRSRSDAARASKVGARRPLRRPHADGARARGPHCCRRRRGRHALPVPHVHDHPPPLSVQASQQLLRKQEAAPQAGPLLLDDSLGRRVPLREAAPHEHREQPPAPEQDHPPPPHHRQGAGPGGAGLSLQGGVAPAEQARSTQVLGRDHRQGIELQHAACRTPVSRLLGQR